MKRLKIATLIVALLFATATIARLFTWEGGMSPKAAEMSRMCDDWVEWERKFGPDAVFRMRLLDIAKEAKAHPKEWAECTAYRSQKGLEYPYFGR